EYPHRAWRATGHSDVDGDDVRDAARARVVLAEDSARAPAIADGDHQLRIRSRLVGTTQRRLHVTRDRPGDQQQVRVPRARDEADAETLDVVHGIAQRMDFQLASIARPGVDVPDAE